MPTPYRMQADDWWLFDRYEIQSGIIRPAPGAHLERYDPWKQYELSRARGAGLTIESPYQALFQLAAAATFDIAGEPTEATEKAILQWCNRYGLLGLKLDPRGPMPVGLIDEHGHPYPDEPLGTYLWRAGVWTAFGYTIGPSDGTEALPLVFGLFAEDPVGGIPEPLSEEFWKGYWESTRDFIHEARILNEAVARLLSKPSTLGALGLADLLNHILCDAEPALDVDSSGSYRLQWRFPNLLTCLAMMILWDLIQGQRVGKCDVCQSLFLSNRADAIYCSPKCRNTALKRRYRDKKRGDSE